MNTQLLNRFLLISLLLIGLLLRLYGLTEGSFTLDESYSVLFSQGSWEKLASFARLDSNPYLSMFLLKAWVELFGTGELSYEVHVSARHGLHIWNVLMEAGKEFNITPVGSDTSMLLRTEKGFIAAGLEGEGALNLYDVGMKWIINNKKGDFIGKRSLQRDLERGGDRQQVVGLEIKNEKHVPASGSPVLNYRAARDIDKIIGKVTSAYFSPNLHFTIALAQVKNGRALHGKFVKVSTKSGDLSAKIVDPIFIDPDGARMKG